MLKLSRLLICIAPVMWWSGMQAGFALTRLFVVSLAVLIGGIALFQDRRDLGSTPMDKPILLFGMVAIAATISGIDPIISILGRYNSYAGGLLGLGLCGCAFYIGRWSEEGSEEAFFRVVAGVAIFAVITALAQTMKLPFAVPSPGGARVGGALGHPVHLGTFVAMATPLFILLRRPLARWGYLIVMAGGLLLSQSRGAAIGACVGLTLTVLWSYGITRRRLLVLGATSLVLGLSLYVLRMDTQASDSFRLSAYRVAWVQFKSKPLLGTGPATFLHSFRRYRDEAAVDILGDYRRTNAHAHNDLAQIASTMGGVGLIAWVWLFLAGGLAVWRKYLSVPQPFWVYFGKKNTATPCCGMLAALIVCMKFNPSPVGLNALACLALGIMLRCRFNSFWDSDSGSRVRIFSHVKRGLIVAIGAASLIVTVRMCQADVNWQYSKILRNSGAYTGALLFARRAVYLMPSNENYKVEKWNLARQLITLGVSRNIMLHESAADSMTLARLRPKVFDGHYLSGVTALNIARSGDASMFIVAKNALTIAQKLNPRHEQIEMLLEEVEKGLAISR